MKIRRQRERTQILFDMANKHGKPLLVGTGDLSASWQWAGCTHNGDHMSMYGVNASVPEKRLCAIFVEYVAGISEKENGRYSL